MGLTSKGRGMTLSHISNWENLFLPIACDRESERLNISLINQSDTKMTWHNMLAIFCKHFTTALEGLAMQIKYFHTKMHQMSFGGRAQPVPAGGAYSAPQTPSCIETPRVFGARSRLTPSALGKQSVPVLLFPIRTLKRAPALRW